MKQGFHRVGRRTMGRVALAGMLGVGLALAGCGGNEDEDQTKADKRGVTTLRFAYDHLTAGMHSGDVVSLVGQHPQQQYWVKIDARTSLLENGWSDYSFGGQENLRVRFTVDGLIAYAQYIQQGDQVVNIQQLF